MRYQGLSKRRLIKLCALKVKIASFLNMDSHFLQL